MQTWFAGAFHTVAPPGNIEGVRAKVTVANLPGKEQKAVWVALVLNNGWFTQVGYSNWGDGASYFMTTLTPGINFPGAGFVLTPVSPPPILELGVDTMFFIKHEGGGIWAVGYDMGNGDVIVSRAQYNGETAAYIAELEIEQSYSRKPGNFPTIHAKPAIDLYIAGVWGAAPNAIGSGDWGIQGKVQNNVLDVNEVNIGSSIKRVQSGTSLWT